MKTRLYRTASGRSPTSPARTKRKKRKSRGKSSRRTRVRRELAQARRGYHRPGPPLPRAAVCPARAAKVRALRLYAFLGDRPPRRRRVERFAEESPLALQSV